MKKMLVIFFLITIVSTWCFSQNTSNVIITSEQLQTANLIFAEHKKFSVEIPKLNARINNLELLNKSWQKSDSTKTKELKFYKQELINASNTIQKLDIKLSRQRTYSIACGSAVIVTLITLLIK